MGFIRNIDQAMLTGSKTRHKFPRHGNVFNDFIAMMSGMTEEARVE